MKGDEVTLARRIDEFVSVYGTLRRAADAIGIDAAYLSRLRSGEKVSPTKDMLMRLGLYRVVTYRKIKTQWTATPEAGARDLEKQDWSRVHHVLQKHGVHPGRTDDHLADVIDKALTTKPSEVESATPERAAPDIQSITRKKLEGWQLDGTLIDRVVGALAEQEREIMRLEAERAAPGGQGDAFSPDEINENPRLKFEPEHWIRRDDGKVVRVDRWEWGLRAIVSVLWGNRQEFEIADVVAKVEELAALQAEPQAAQSGAASGYADAFCSRLALALGLTVQGMAAAIIESHEGEQHGKR